MTPRLLPTISLPLILLVEVHSQIPFVDIPFVDVKFDSFYRRLLTLISVLKWPWYITQVHRRARITAVGSASVTIATVDYGKMGGIGAGKKAVGASSACPRSADCPRDCPRVRSSPPAFKKGSFALLFPNTNSFSSSQESQFFSQRSKFRATDSVAWSLVCTFRRSPLVALNTRSWWSSATSFRKKSRERSAVLQWRSPIHQLTVQSGSRAGGPRLGVDRWRRLSPLLCSTHWRRSFMERALRLWAIRIPDGASGRAEAQTELGHVIYTVREMAKISQHFPAPSSVPDALGAADIERRRRRSSSLLAFKKTRPGCSCSERSWFDFWFIPWKFVGAEDLWPRFDFQLSWKIGGAAEQEEGRKSEHLCSDKGEEFLGLLVSLEEILGELKNILLGFVLNSKGSSDDNICSLKNCYTWLAFSIKRVVGTNLSSWKL